MRGSSRRATAFMASEQAAIATTGPAGGPALFFPSACEGIRRTDRLCAELWKTIQNEPEYAGWTTLFILPDFGRDADDDAGGNGFQHHRTGDASSRTTWMMALGAGVRAGQVFDRPIQSIDLVPTVGAMMGFSPSLSQGTRLEELL